MSDKATIEVHERTDFSKNANRRLRLDGQIPAVVYGLDRDPVAIRVDRRTIWNLLRKEGGENAVFLLKMAGTDKSRHTMIRDLQVDPITNEVQHLDFLRVNMDEVVRVSVPVELEGTPYGVRNESAIVDFVTREVEVECLPGNIPNSLSVEVTELHVNEHVSAEDVELPEGITLVTEGDRVIASVTMPRMEEEVEEDEDDLIEAERDEPEVIGREDEEGEEEEG